jgi:hypothetical protein
VTHPSLRGWLAENLAANYKELRSRANRARGAYTRGPLFEMATRLADAYGKAAEVFGEALVEEELRLAKEAKGPPP